MSEKAVKRAGLDHWEKLKLSFHSDWEEFLQYAKDPSRIFLVTKFGKTTYYENQFQDGDFLVFGSETSGLPPEVHASIPDIQKLKIPMLDESVRSLNLSNSVAIVAYEAIRQLL